MYNKWSINILPSLVEYLDCLLELHFVIFSLLDCGGRNVVITLWLSLFKEVWKDCYWTKANVWKIQTNLANIQKLLFRSKRSEVDHQMTILILKVKMDLAIKYLQLRLNRFDYLIFPVKWSLWLCGSVGNANINSKANCGGTFIFEGFIWIVFQ